MQSDEEMFWRSFSSTSSRVGPIRCHYVTGGSGDVVVLLHGWPQTWFEWRDVMPYLAKRYRVIAVDLPGLGDSTGSESYRDTTVRISGNATSAYLPLCIAAPDVPRSGA